MKLTRRTTVWLVLAGMVAAFALGHHLTRPNEPEYQGKPLSSWLEDLDDPKTKKGEHATEAVLQMGSNVVPSLVELIQRKDSKIQRMLWDLNENSPVRLSLTPASYYRWLACNGFRVLGTNAFSAIPKLSELLDNGDCGVQAVDALVAIGPQASIPLMRSYDHTNSSIRRQVFKRLGLLSIEDRTQLPQLLQKLQDTNLVERINAVKQLDDILPSASPIVVPALANCLGDQSPGVRGAAAEVLGTLRSGAKSALSLLHKLLHDENKSVREAAAEAIEQIAPEPIKKTGVN